MMTIGSVTSVDGRPLKFNYKGGVDNDNLEIELGQTVKDGQDVTVKIDVHDELRELGEQRHRDRQLWPRHCDSLQPTADDPKKPRQIWSQGESEFNRYWFPSYDSPNDFRTTELRATVEKPFFVVSNGKLMSTKDNADGTRTFYWKMDQPYSNYLTSIVVMNTTPVEQKRRRHAGLQLRLPGRGQRGRRDDEESARDDQLLFADHRREVSVPEIFAGVCRGFWRRYGKYLGDDADRGDDPRRPRIARRATANRCSRTSLRTSGLAIT